MTSLPAAVAWVFSKTGASMLSRTVPDPTTSSGSASGVVV